MFVLTLRLFALSFFFFFNDTATTEIYTLSLHDALPILVGATDPNPVHAGRAFSILKRAGIAVTRLGAARSEEHTSELQSLRHLVCRLLLEKKKQRRPLMLQIVARAASYGVPALSTPESN